MIFNFQKVMSGRENLPNIRSKSSGIISDSKVKSNNASSSSVTRSKSPNTAIRKKSSKKSPAKKKYTKNKKKSPVVNNSEKVESCHKFWKENSDAHLMYTDVSQKSSEEIINNNVTLDPDVFRWENQCENSEEETKRIEIYKTNRRLRYINARNTQLALLAIKEKK